jgi:hypothetical protein
MRGKDADIPCAADILQVGQMEKLVPLAGTV